MGQITQFVRRSFSKPEIYPLFVILGGALTGAVYMFSHQARAPDVVWDHHANSQPWQHVKDGEQVKLAAYNQKYDRKYQRREW
ncbi:hypothetical protein BDF20DRAFT_819837 [Mycotypha africana]|uniref:uncharacterized protein n=1 Tax=Mycotypha africana TaxID=64632 RepID=UPI0022FFCFD8|nr:uncharacterized protein BDF20DRAFT_819837 [Mycotypha africana]KAI8979849.1 hypothetical protein BDF20DRAFT_819837 [Mycotypha africana]